MVFDGLEHVRLASLDGMWERTLTIGSGGKTFSVTGWKIGWVFACEALVQYMWGVHQSVAFTIATPLQEAVAIAFEHAFEVNYFETFKADLLQRRDKLARSIRDAGLTPIIPEGSYFMLAITDSIEPPEGEDESLTRDFRLAHHLIRHHRLATIPPSAFYSEAHRYLAASYLRFCFCKTDELLDAALVQLLSIKQS